MRVKPFLLALAATIGAVHFHEAPSLVMQQQDPFAITRGLVGWWPLREGSGSSTQDASGKGYTGTLYNMEAGDWVAGPKGGLGALLFDGSNEYVGIPPFSEITAYPFTICAWLRSSGNIAFGLSAAADDDPLFLVALSGGTQPRLNTRDGDNSPLIEQLDWSGTVTSDTWHHVCGVWNSESSRQIYLDGSAGTSSTAGSYTVDVTHVSLGRLNRPSVSYYAGRYADPRIYSRALTAAEIAALAEGR